MVDQHREAERKLVESAVCDGPLRDSFERLARLARRSMRTPVAQVNVVVDEVQHSLASVAGGPENASRSGSRGAPLDFSFCQHVARSGAPPLVVNDARSDPRVRNSRAVTEGGMRSLAAVPLNVEEGGVAGALCVADFEPREWDPIDVETLSSLADFVAEEIRRRIDAERARQRGDARFRSLIENASDLIAIIDSDCRILYSSPAFRRSLGHDPEALLGRTITDLVHPAEVTRLEAAFTSLLAEPGSRGSGEYRMRHADGSWRVLDGIAVNLLHDPAVGGVVANIHDVTKQRQVEEELRQAQKMEAVGRLAGGIAHDFNNLLTAVRGNTSFLLGRDDLPEEVERDIREISDTTDRGTRLTSQLLTFSRRNSIEPQRIEVGSVMREAAALLERLAGADVDLVTRVEPELWVHGDDGQLGQVVVNLAVNARDAMPSGGTLTLEARRVDLREGYAGSHSQIEPGHYVMLVVSDDGIGMSRVIQQKIFDPFFTTKPVGKGTGLGLSTCWGIVTRMEGHIHVYSEPERGTIFRIYLPEASGDDSRAELEPEVAPEAPPLPFYGTILLVEDDPAVRRVVKRSLESAGHKVEEAESGAAALEIAERLTRPVDLLLTDMVLPRMSGFELAVRLLDRWPDLPVVFTSGYSPEEMAEWGADVPNAVFLQKPFEPTQIRNAVAHALAGCAG